MKRPFFPWMFFKAMVRTGIVSLLTLWQGLRGTTTHVRIDRSIAWWAGGLLRDAHITLDIRGREHLEPYGPMVIMSNHQSLYDIPSILVGLPPSVRMVAKSELFRIPIWGRAMAAAGFIEIDRKNRDRARASLRLARKRLEDGVQVWIAPEGTRSPDGKLLPFKKGGFVLAAEMEIPILPITINGTREVLPAHTWSPNAGTVVRLTIHPRVPQPSSKKRDDWMRSVRERIESGLS